VRCTFAKLTVILTAALIAVPSFAASNVKGSATPSTSTRKTASPSNSRSTAKKSTSAKKKTSASTRRASSRKPRIRGQQAIQPERVTQIQQALIREHYLSGDANGNWDDSTVAAMRKFQADQGWQTKLMPDSRAIKKLGLGPDYSTAINAKDSSFVDPPPINTIPTEQASGFTAASGVKQ
jgi:peptidoglycan hydrolase-like protein with peptidoglycan-binding domain